MRDRSTPPEPDFEGPPVPLVAILGAGASHGSGEYPSLRPPLTSDLFEDPDFDATLARHDLAHQAGRYIEDIRRRDDTLGLEQALHGMLVSGHEHHRRMAMAVPHYLQDLLVEISAHRYREAFRYDRLIERLLCLPYVFFVTLNYDVILDRRLALHRPLGGFDDYLGEGQRDWSLIKLHGSVNWYYETGFEREWRPSEPLDFDESDLRCAAPDEGLEGLLGFSEETLRFPALALPEGPEDHLVLPSQHLSFLTERLALARQYDLLLIGYSGLDGEVMSLLAESEARVRHLTIVDRSAESAEEVEGRVGAAGIDPIWTHRSQDSFQKWCDLDGLERLVSEYGGSYPRSH